MEEWLGSKAPPGLSLGMLLARMAAAVVLGAFIAWRPLSRLCAGRTTKPEVAHALVLMAAASMFAMVVIGDSLARAFGVVGLGSFVRFRTAIKDPADAVLFFAAIGIGMACAVGLVPYAAAGVAVLSLVMVPRDRGRRKREEQEERGAARSEVRHETVSLPGAGPDGGMRG